MNSLERSRAWGLYIHSPFCVHKCGYCDFNSWGEVRREPQRRWLEAIVKQLRYWAERLGPETHFDTVFWGGGTPSLIEDDLMADFFAEVRGAFRIEASAEITLEANPETLTSQKLRHFADLGINRLSMGVQSFQDVFLERLERHARRRDNLRALELLTQEWRGRWSMDLMFGLPRQTLEQWREDLELAATFKPSHLSAYQLTLTTERSKNWQQGDDRSLLHFFDLAEEFLAERGLRRYEVSNFARPGEECRHNLKYWELTPFLGIGPGASGLLPARADWGHSRHQKNPDNFDLWAKNAGDDSAERSYLTERNARDHLQEKLMMGLRLERGISLGELGLPESTFPELLQRPDYRGYLFWDAEQRLRCSPEGLRILDSLLVKLYRDLEKYA